MLPRLVLPGGGLFSEGELTLVITSCLITTSLGWGMINQQIIIGQCSRWEWGTESFLTGVELSHDSSFCDGAKEWQDSGGCNGK